MSGPGPPDDRTPGPVVVLGAGGHGLVVAEALAASGWNVLGFVERDEARAGESRGGFEVLGGDAALARLDPASVRVALGVGGLDAGPSAAARRRVLETAVARGFRAAGLVHPSAVLAPSATVEETAQIHAGAVVQGGAHVAEGAIVNTRAVVEHDASVGAWAHVAPGAVVLGDVEVGPGALVGAGATVLSGLTVGAETLVGAGAVLTRDAGGGVWVGAPARRR
ncbi:MAG: acetyltransferase [Planctomycetota bacterium]